MSRFWQTVGSLWGWAGMGLCILIWFPTLALVWAVTVPWDRGRYLVGRWFRIMGRAMAACVPFWDFHTDGERIANPRNPYVVVSNHESFADILLISHLPWEMKWMSKREILQIPVLGWMMRMAGDISLNRGVRASGADAIKKSKAVLAQRVSVIIFPEGTRSTTPDMLPFKPGAFRLAIEAGVPILPLAVAGTGTALPKHDWRFGRSRAVVRVLPPIPTAGMTIDDIPRLKDRVRALILEARDQMRAELT